VIGGAGVSAGGGGRSARAVWVLSRWLGARGLAVAELDPERVEDFLDARRAAGYRSYVAGWSVRLPLDYLIGIGAH
jgi:hypothetical protein